MLRQSKYLDNIVEQDHRAIKRIVRPMLGFNSFRCARMLIAGIELMHMIKKGQFDWAEGQVSSAESTFGRLSGRAGNLAPLRFASLPRQIQGTAYQHTTSCARP